MATRLRTVAILAIAWATSGVSCKDSPAERSSEPAAGGPDASANDVEATLLRVCDAGNDAACEKLQAKYLSGEGVPQSRDKSAALTQRLCESGRRYFCPTYAFLLDQGDGVPKDAARARRLFAETCADDPVACSEFGHLYRNGVGVQRDPELGLFLLELACRHGDAKACQELPDAPPPLASSLPVAPPSAP